MPASSKRAARVKMRKQYENHTGVKKKAKRQTLNTENERDEVARDLGNRKKFHEKDLCELIPLNDKQEEFLQLYYQETPMIVATGPAGTAKTFLSMYCALSDVFREGSGYEKVIIVRSTVPTRDSGFLPGTQEEKNEPFESPYEEVAKELLPDFNDPYRHLKSLGYLEFASTAHQRGVTWNNAIIIVDEFASCNYHELCTLATRMGYNSRIIFCGDFKQSDLINTRDCSGFHHFMRVVEGMPQKYYGVVEYGLNDIVRSDLVREFLISDFHNG